jgi:hypothetical protein
LQRKYYDFTINDAKAENINYRRRIFYEFNTGEKNEVDFIGNKKDFFFENLRKNYFENKKWEKAYEAISNRNQVDYKKRVLIQEEVYFYLSEIQKAQIKWNEIKFGDIPLS